jgi:RNA polymerase sigma factor (sigma-70 family)
MLGDDTIATRASLLDRLKDREDQASWQEFFDTYWRLIYAVATKAGLSDAEAQDVVQETVISVAKNVGEFHYDPKVCSFKTWMLRMTRWRIIDRIRRREREAVGLGHRVHLGQAEDPARVQAPRDDRTDRTATLERLPDPAGINLERIWDEEWKQTTLAAAMESIRQRIRPEQFQMFHLYAVKQLPVMQVARMAGVSIPSVYVAKHRVAALLKKEVQRLEAALPGQMADRA